MKKVRVLVVDDNRRIVNLLKNETITIVTEYRNLEITLLKFFNFLLALYCSFDILIKH